MNGTFTTPYRPQSYGLCEGMNQTTENIIKCTVRDERDIWDKSLDLVIDMVQSQYVSDREGDKHAGGPDLWHTEE